MEACTFMHTSLLLKELGLMKENGKIVVSINDAGALPEKQVAILYKGWLMDSSRTMSFDSS